MAKIASSKGPGKGNRSGKPGHEYMTPPSAKNGKNRGMLHGKGMKSRARGPRGGGGDNPFHAAAKY